MLSASNLSWYAGHGRDGLPIVNKASLEVRPGECVGLVGPNGCGKSTLLQMLYRILKPCAGGQVLLGGRSIWQMSTREFAQQAAVMEQTASSVFDSTVEDAVMLGRLPHQALWSGSGAKDRGIVQQSLERVGASRLLRQQLSSLSGGERQRVLLARALAQEPRLLFLDEPTNHLDIRYQLELMSLIQTLECSTVVVLHDLNIAAQFCDRLYLMHEGSLLQSGTPVEILTSSNIFRAFGVAADVDVSSGTGRPSITYRMQDYGR